MGSTYGVDAVEENTIHILESADGVRFHHFTQAARSWKCRRRLFLEVFFKNTYYIQTVISHGQLESWKAKP